MKKLALAALAYIALLLWVEGIRLALTDPKAHWVLALDPLFGIGSALMAHLPTWWWVVVLGYLLVGLLLLVSGGDKE